jgi:hypothetical protein
MEILRGKFLVATLAAAAVTLVGCGGSSGSSSAERTKLVNQLSSQLGSSSIPSDLSGCMTRQARSLPIDQLRTIVQAGANPPPATKKIGVDLVTTCVSQGSGLSALHAVIVNSIKSSVPSTVPPSFTQCVVAKANATTAGQLSQLISAYANEDQATASKQAEQVGVGLAHQCLNDPGVDNALRALLVQPIEQAFKTSKFSSAYKRCILSKARQFPLAKLKQAALHPSIAERIGEAFGRNAAKACIASGATP